ncbi:hypothetical protein EDC96DRAFT_491223 [Choanephora cucurbitarum]|nr:hypothetical protein EDC96DRAFT_491223 [Choanephora cucurbitarum]
MIQLTKIKRRLHYIILAGVGVCFLYYLWLFSKGEPIHESTWTCKGAGRHQICEFDNLCVDRYRGPFVVSDKEPPRVNVANADEAGDIWFQPTRMTPHRLLRARHIPETLFVYGLYAPYHFSHMLYNGLMPLYSTMQSYGASNQVWTMRAGTYQNKHTPVSIISSPALEEGHDIVLERADVLTDQQALPPHQTICFSKAIVGSGNRCSHAYCENQIPAAHYASFKQVVLDQAAAPNNPCAASQIVHKETGQYRVGILNRKQSRHITNMPDLIARLTSMTQEQDGVDFSVVSIDFESGCNLINTAHTTKDLDVLIAPYGNGLGAGLFMKDDAVVIAIMSRYWNDGWFKFPMTAIGRRVFNFECTNEICKEYEPKLAQQVLDIYGVQLNTTEMNEFMTTSNPEPLLNGRIPGHAWYPFLQYYKDVARRVDTDRFIPFLKDIMHNKPSANISYPDSCRKPNVCCDLDCNEALERNVFSETSAWK